MGWRDELGKQRWRTTGTELEDAIALRDEVHGAVAA